MFEFLNTMDPTLVTGMGIFIGLIALIWIVSQFLVSWATTMPTGKYPKLTLEGYEDAMAKAKNHMKIINANGANEGTREGFFGGAANGAGEPSCLRTLADAAAVYQTLETRVGGHDGSAQDLAELRLLLSKWACLKKDLMSPSGIVDATRQLPYSTMHDRIPVPDLAGQCNAKSVPLRDLDITFDTWKSRGKFLLRRLAANANMTNSEAAALEAQMMNAFGDVYDIAKSQCISTVPAGKMNPRDALPRTPDELTDIGTYSGYF